MTGTKLKVRGDHQLRSPRHVETAWVELRREGKRFINAEIIEL